MERWKDKSERGRDWWI